MITEETLTLYYFKDGLTAAEMQQVEIALHRDADLANRYAELCNDMQRLEGTDPEPAPTHLLHRLHSSIDLAATAEVPDTLPTRPPFRVWSFAWGAGLTAALAVGVGIGNYFSADTAVNPPGVAPMTYTPPSPAAGESSAFTRGLQVHLLKSQSDLADLPGDAAADRSLLMLQIIGQNRMYVRAAEANGSSDLARVLRAFEPILMRLASEDITPEDAEAIRAQLAFELNVMLTKLSQPPSEQEHSI